jgi:hypothetical protein
VPIARLDGAKTVTLPATKHANFLPTPGRSIKLPLQWYGDSDALEQWKGYLVDDTA